MWQKRDVTKTYKKGDLIVKEGDPGKEMFIIQSGSVDVIREDGDKKVIFNTLERGDFFGEMALLEQAPRSATVVAREDTKLLVLNIGNFLTKIKRDPTFAFNIMQRMSKRIRILGDRLLRQTDVKAVENTELGLSIAETEYTKPSDT
jgi:CRP-like cAMP-binding protein